MLRHRTTGQCREKKLHQGGELPLLEGDESGAVGGSNTGPTVLHLNRVKDQKASLKNFCAFNTHRLVGDRELPQVVSDHLWLHLNLREKSLNWFKLVGKVNVLKERHFDPTNCIICSISTTNFHHRTETFYF